MHFLRNGEECNFNKTLWYEGGLIIEYIGTTNVREEELNPRLVYDIVRLDNLQNNIQRGVTIYRRV